MTVSSEPATVYRFGEFELDVAAHELHRNGLAIALPSKVYACVLYLVENRHRAVERDDLMRAVWGHVHLTESVLGQAIRHARQVLCDTGDDQHTIKTVRGFGYRWAAPVEVATARIETSSPEIFPSRYRNARRYGVTFGALAVVALIAAWIPSAKWLDSPAHDPVPRDTTAEPRPKDAIALLLPVTSTNDPDDAWIRLGLMEYIANRLRADGQPMVPTDTVILLLHGAAGDAESMPTGALTTSTQARTVLAAEAEHDGSRWRVSVHTAGDSNPPARGTGEGANLLDAARIAADNVAIALGRVPIAELDATPDLSLLRQRIDAALLMQNHELARRIIESAPDTLRATPEVRFYSARLDFYDHNWPKAEASFNALLDEVPESRDPSLRARILNGLAVMHAVRGDRAQAEPLLLEAAHLLERDDAEAMRDTRGSIWMNLGNIAQERGDLDLASDRMAEARRMFEATGDVRNLGELELNVGVIETRREHFADALQRFDDSARLDAAIHNATDELKALCYVVQVRLRLLDAAAGEPLVPRINELLQTTTEPELVALAKLSLSDLDYAGGHHRLASRLLDEVLASRNGDAHLALVGFDAVAERAERAADAGDLDAAAKVAGELVGEIKADCTDPEAEDLNRARLVLVRAGVARGDVAAASKAAADLAVCADAPSNPSRVRAALAEAEIAAAAGRGVAAGDAFERALTLADESRIPARVLDVAERYADWLLADAEPDQARLLRISERVAGFADRNYAAALVELRVYRKLGPAAAWQAAFVRAQRQAGERRIPPELSPAT